MLLQPVHFRLTPVAASVRLAIAGGLGAVFVAPLAQASDTGKDGIENILVTGVQDDGLKADAQVSGKMPLKLRETPQSITVITRESLDDRQVANLQQALELSAGVTQYSGNGPFAGQPSFGFNQTTIRGIEIDSIYDFRDDGFVSGSYFSMPDLSIYERIEVVKGPNSVLYGRGSVGGLINRIRKQPLDERHVAVEVSAGSFDTYRTDIDITGPLNASKSLRGRLIGAYEDSDTFVDGPNTQLVAIAPSIDIDITDSTRLQLMGFYQNQEIVPNTGMPLRMTESGDFKAAPHLDRRDYQGVVTQHPYDWKTESATAQLQQDIGDRWLATLRLSASRIDSPIRTDSYAYGLYEGGYTYVLGNDFHIDREVLAGEVQVVGHLDLFGRDVMVGFGADRNSNQYSRRGAYTEYLPANLYNRDIPLPDRSTLAPGFQTDDKPISEGAYIQARVSLMDRLAVLVGFRYDKVKLDNSAFHPVGESGGPKLKDQEDETTGRIGVTYDLTRDASIYALYAQSFTPELFSTDINGGLLEPQTGEIYEMGIKTEWFDNRLSATAAVYRVDRKNIATSVPDDPNDEIPPYSIASGLQRSDGFEVELNGSPLPGWNVSMAYNYVDSAYKDREDPLYGSKPGGTPDWQVGVYSSYEIQTGPLRGAGFGATYFAIDDRGIGYIPATIPGYERVDVYAFYNGFRNVEANLMVRNITSAHYVEGADRPGAYAQYGSPTAVMLSVKYSR